MIDLTQSTFASPALHLVPTDPGLSWADHESLDIDAPPDSDTDPSPEARWPADAPRTGVCGAVTPRVVRLPGGDYRMYYTQILPRAGVPAGANDYDNATTRILSATSPDAEQWTPEPGVRLSAANGGAGEFRVVSPDITPCADGSGRLRMYYECCLGPQSVQNSIRSALSEDGLEWTPEPGVRLERPGVNYMAPRIIFLDDGGCRLYCTQRGRGIVSALSTDGGLTFQIEEGVRVSRDKAISFAPDIARVAGGGYRMYYVGHMQNPVEILSAVSDDGLHWQKESTPVLTPSGRRWGAAKCSEPCIVLVDGCDGDPPRYRLFYEACDGTTTNQRGVWRIASSPAAD